MSARAATSTTTVVSTRLTAAGRSATGIRTVSGGGAFAGASGSAGFYGYSGSSTASASGAGSPTFGGAGLSSPTSRAAKPAVHTEVHSPGGSDYESDVSQGDHLLQARDRSKRSPSTSCACGGGWGRVQRGLPPVADGVTPWCAACVPCPVDGGVAWLAGCVCVSLAAHAPSPLARGTVSGPSSARLR